MGIVWILTHMAPLVEHGKLWIPQDLMREAGLKANIVAKRQTNQALTDTVATMCLIAERHLNSARNEKAGKQAAQILSQSAIVDAWLQQLRSSNYDVACSVSTTLTRGTDLRSDERAPTTSPVSTQAVEAQPTRTILSDNTRHPRRLQQLCDIWPDRPNHSDNGTHEETVRVPRDVMSVKVGGRGPPLPYALDEAGAGAWGRVGRRGGRGCLSWPSLDRLDPPRNR